VETERHKLLSARGLSAKTTAKGIRTHACTNIFRPLHVDSGTLAYTNANLFSPPFVSFLTDNSASC